jgi:hypothetical protein
MKKIVFLLLLIAIPSALIFSSFHWLRLQASAWLGERSITDQETINSIRPVFTYLPAGWMSPMKQDMNRVWEPLGLRGTHYFTFGEPETVISKYTQRSNPDSKYYQAMFGVYVISGGEDRFMLPGNEIDIEALGRLAQFEQITRLKAMGDPQPIATWTGFIRQDRILMEGIGRPCFEGTIVSHSDLTDRRDLSPVRLLGTPPRSRWEDTLSPYHPLTLKGIYGGWHSAVHGVTIVYYGYGSVFTTRTGVRIDYYQEIKQDLIRLAEGVKMIAVGRMIG